MHWEVSDRGDGLLVWGEASIYIDAATKTRLSTGVFDYDLAEFAPNGLESPETVFVKIKPTRAVHALAYGSGGVHRWQQADIPDP